MVPQSSQSLLPQHPAHPVSMAANSSWTNRLSTQTIETMRRWGWSSKFEVYQLQNPRAQKSAFQSSGRARANMASVCATIPRADCLSVMKRQSTGADLGNVMLWQRRPKLWCDWERNSVENVLKKSFPSRELRTSEYSLVQQNFRLDSRHGDGPDASSRHQ